MSPNSLVSDKPVALRFGVGVGGRERTPCHI